MSRKRLVSPEFFTHGELYDAERRAGLPLRLAFAGLWTVCDRRGLFRWRPRELKLAILPYDDADFEAVLQALAAAGFVERYVVGNKEYGRVPSFSQWQTFHRNEKASDVPEPSNGRPEPTKGRRNPPVVITGTGTGTGTSAVVAPPTAAGLIGPAEPAQFDLAPYADDWQAEYGGPMPGAPNAAALRWLERKHGAAETRRRWRLYLAATGAQYASAQKLKSGWGQWAAAPVRGGVGSAPTRGRVLLDLMRRYDLFAYNGNNDEYEAKLVAASEDPSAGATFRDEARLVKPWKGITGDSDHFKALEIEQRLRSTVAA